MMRKQSFYQANKLIRFYLKRERVKLPVWIINIVAVNLAVALAFSGLYQSKEERQMMAETMENPAMKALIGRGFGLDNYTNGAMLSHQMLLMTMVVVAIMSILLVIRLTRADEENNQLEMLLALPIGRLSPSFATVVILVVSNLILGLITAFGLALFNIDSIDLIGSLAYGTALFAVGIFFGAVTLLTAQLSNNQRGAMMLAYLVLGVSYIIRAVGDAGDNILSVLSPLGLLLETQAYVNNYFWPSLVILALSDVIIVISLSLRARRDLGSGLLPDRAGKAEASNLLKTLPGLALNLQKVPLWSWAVGMVLIGLSYGSVLGDLEGFLTENEAIMQIIGNTETYSITEQFISILMKIMAIISTIPALMVFHRIKTEERFGRLDHLLARPISRLKVFITYVSLGFLTSIVMLVLGIVSLAGIGVSVIDVSISFMTLVKAQLVYLPAIWLVLSVMVMIYGLKGKWEGFSWFYLLFSFITIYLGDLLELPTVVMRLSPFNHIPELPVDSFQLLPLILVSGLALIFYSVGALGFMKRDIREN